MHKIESRTLGIEQGHQILFSDFDQNGEMWVGAGSRSRRVPVRFSEKYRRPPVVQVHLNMWDMDVGANQRANISAENITPRGFEIVFHTWGDTKVARVGASWTAMGEVKLEEDWEV